MTVRFGVMPNIRFQEGPDNQPKESEPIFVEQVIAASTNNISLPEVLRNVSSPPTDKVTIAKPETRMEISDITQRPLIIDGKQVEEETNNSEISELVITESDPEAEESIRTP
ncbi:hypothetical protein CBL_12152 [Carabus blaptoides fortunei]